MSNSVHLHDQNYNINLHAALGGGGKKPNYLSVCIEDTHDNTHSDQKDWSMEACILFTCSDNYWTQLSL